ncbi:putative membrane protein [Flammeovirga yaeyamensis]|nr:putative membrane protein [Flammeovirga yaeyamensis]
MSTVGTVIGNPGFIAATLVQPLVGLSILGVTFSVVFLVSYGTILLANDTVTFEQA